MSKTLSEIAKQLRGANKKVQLIYAFNGTGKTRLSREFKQLIAPKSDSSDESEGTDEESDADVDEDSGLSRDKILYYNAFTEDLFYWDNDLELDAEPKLKIQPNSFTDWVLNEQGQDQNIIANFQRYTNDKLTPKFNPEYKTTDNDGKKVVVPANSEVTFNIATGSETNSANLKISKGEESNFIWSIFYSLLDQVIENLNEPEPENRDSNAFDQLEYVFIDDPVSSLDENHLIELAVDIGELIKSNLSETKFICTTHNPLFFNVLHSQLCRNNKKTGYKSNQHYVRYQLEKLEDESHRLAEVPRGDSFSYHLYLKSELEKAIESGGMMKNHFNYLRNIFEKTASFLGYESWGDILPQTDDGLSNPYEARLLNLRSHTRYSTEEVMSLEDEEKRVLKHLVRHLNKIYTPDLKDSSTR